MECFRPCPCPFRPEVLSVKRRRILATPVPTLPPDSILNTDAAALDALPGIGTVLSERIITYREEHGAFVYPEDLRNVQGIGAELQTKITDSLDDESTNPLIAPAAETTAVPRATLPPDSILNTGDAAALDALPGIGTVLSERIVAYREEHGAFVYPEELRNVKGIGEKRLQAILDALAGESAEESD
ncbi:MAG: ComEA family DNA-binding protein [Christensenellales bacterium]